MGAAFHSPPNPLVCEFKDAGQENDDIEVIQEM